MAIDIRENLDDKCRRCGKTKDEANEIGPVMTGGALGPPLMTGEWSCGECMDVIEENAFRY